METNVRKLNKETLNGSNVTLFLENLIQFKGINAMSIISSWFYQVQFNIMTIINLILDPNIKKLSWTATKPNKTKNKPKFTC
jgi:hypothetical protein